MTKIKLHVWIAACFLALYQGAAWLAFAYHPHFPYRNDHYWATHFQQYKNTTTMDGIGRLHAVPFIVLVGVSLIIIGRILIRMENEDNRV